jgi:hypothetical protein
MSDLIGHSIFSLTKLLRSIALTRLSDRSARSQNARFETSN